jgi:hypothetical protein
MAISTSKIGGDAEFWKSCLNAKGCYGLRVTCTEKSHHPRARKMTVTSLLPLHLRPPPDLIATLVKARSAAYRRGIFNLTPTK